MRRYNKLVRDKIPEHLDKLNLKHKTHIADNNEYFWKLKEKLMEEVTEFIKEDTLEELADIVEVVHALAAYKNTTPKELEDIRTQKERERGAFKKRIILDVAEE